MKVKERGKEEDGDSDDSNDQSPESIDETAVYKQIVELLKPGETILKGVLNIYLTHWNSCTNLHTQRENTLIQNYSACHFMTYTHLMWCSLFYHQ